MLKYVKRGRYIEIENESERERERERERQEHYTYQFGCATLKIDNRRSKESTVVYLFL